MKEITILSTTDVHGFLTASNESLGGLLSAKEIRREYPDSIFIDNGDYLVGSPLSVYYNQTKKISPLMDLANELGYDVMIPGNHDFDYGIDFLRRQAASFSGAYLCSNVVTQDDEEIFAPFTILQRQGKKIGIIGAVTSAMPQITPYEKIKDLKFLDAVTTIKKWSAVLRSQVDVLICAYHGGIERDMLTGLVTQYDTGEDQTYRIIQEIEELDGVICGHQHRLNDGVLNNTAFVQPGYRANVLGLLTFGFTEDKLVQRKAELIETGCYPANLTNFAEDLAGLDQWLGEELDTRYLADFILQRTGLALQNVQLKGASRQAFLASFPVPYALSRYHLSKDELQKLIGSRQIALSSGELGASEDCVIISNTGAIPAWRLEMNYVINMLDEYEYYVSLQKNKT